MDLRELECFLAVVDEDSFTLAAGRLGVAQSTVSTTVKQLERRVGGPLLRRRHPPLSLTPLGELVADHARGICAAVGDLRAAVDECRAGRPLRVGVFVGGIGRATPLLLASLRRTPGLTVAVSSVRGGDQVPRLLDGSVDAVLTTGPFGDDRLVRTRLCEQERIAVVGAHHELAGCAVLTPAELLDRPQMRTVDGDDRDWADYWRLVPERGGEAPRQIDGFAADFLTRLRQHAFSDVVTLTPAYLAGYAPEAYFGVRYLRVDGLAPTEGVLLTRRDDPVTNRLALLAAEAARELVTRTDMLARARRDPVGTG